MPVYVDQFLYENKSWLPKNRNYKDLQKRYKQLKKLRSADIANDMMAKELLSGCFEQYDPDQPITHKFRRFAIMNTPFIGDGGRP